MRIAIQLLALPFVLGAQTPASPATSPAEQLFHERKYDEASAAFQAQLAANRNDANAMYWLGRIAAAENRTGNAIDWLEKAVARDERHAVYHFWLGSALGSEAQRANRLRQPFLARRVKREFERAVALDPRMIDARLGLLDFYSVAPGVMGGSMEKAREQAAEIAKLSVIRGHMANARLALRQKNDSAAFREYEAAIAASPDSAAPYYGLASIHRSRRHWAAALAVYDRLMKRLPDEPFARVNYGVVAAQSGIEMQRGERELRVFITSPPKEALPQTMSTAHFRLGTILEKTARIAEAKTEYAEALKLNPGNEDARKALDALK